MLQSKWWVLLTLTLSLAGCRLTPRPEDAPRSGTPAQPAAPRVSAPESSPASRAVDRLKAGPLTLADALLLAEALNPELAAAGAGADAARGRRLQAGLYPNPTLTLSAEDGPARNLGLRHGTKSVEIEQTLILGGRRGAARNEGRADVRVAEAEREVARRQLRHAVTTDFLNVVYAQRLLVLSRELRDLALRFNDVTQARVDLQAAPEMEALKTRIEAERMSQEVADAEGRLVSARRLLAADLGDESLPVGECSGAMGDPTIAHDPGLLRKKLIEEHPLLTAAAREIERAEATLARRRAERVPDLTLGVGWGWIEDEHETVMQTTLGIPLPVFDRNQGSIAEAEAERRRARLLSTATLNALLAQLDAAQARYSAAATKVRAYRERILPASEKAQSQSQDAYGLGKSSILEAIDAQRTLIETRTAALDAEKELGEAAAELEALTEANFLAPAPGNQR